MTKPWHSKSEKQVVNIHQRQKEKTFQKAVIQYAHANGWIHYHTYDSRRSPAGFPDLVLIHTTMQKILFVELKTETGRVRESQQAFLTAITDAGGHAYLWRPSDWPEIEATLQRHCRILIT